MDEGLGTHLILLEEIIIPQEKEPPESWECLGLENLYLLLLDFHVGLCQRVQRKSISVSRFVHLHVKFLLLSSDRCTKRGINILIVFCVSVHAVSSTWNGFIPTCLIAR